MKTYKPQLGAKKANLSGRFGRLTIIGPYERIKASYKGYVYKYPCRCDCGNELSVDAAALMSGHTQSCGCYNKDRRHQTSFKHGMTGTPEYQAWIGMRQRCTNPNFEDYHNYGGRGIRVAPEWDSFERFFADVGLRPSPEHTLDRVDNDGDYRPGNVRWATRVEQMNNTRLTTWLEAFGERLTIQQWAVRTGVNSSIIRRRLLRGWPVERALSEPSQRPYRLDPRMQHAQFWGMV